MLCFDGNTACSSFLTVACFGAKSRFPPFRSMLENIRMSAPAVLGPPPEIAAVPKAPPRLPVVDAARGVAIAAMFVFHFTWDLGFFNFIDLQAGVDPAWRAFAKAIAGS